MGPANAIRTGFAKSFQFSGRSDRAEFWWFAPVALPLSLLLHQVVLELGDLFRTRSLDFDDYSVGIFMALNVPFLAAMTRRVRDAGYSRFLVRAALVAVLVGLSAVIFPVILSGAALIWWVAVSAAGPVLGMGLLFTVPLFLIYLLFRPSAPDADPQQDVSSPEVTP